MPLYSIQGPDGKTYEIEGPEGATRDQVIAAIQSRMASQPQEEPKRLAGFGGSFMDAVTTLGLADEAAAYGANPTDETRKKFLEAAKSKYDSAGGFGKGQDWEYFKELLGGSLGAMAAPLAAGAAGSMAGPIGGLAAMGTTSAAQYTIQNLERQAQEQQASIDQGLTPNKTDVGKAALAAVPQAGMDVAGTLVFGPIFKAFPFTKGLASGASKEVAIMADAIKNGTLKTVGGGVVKGVGKGIAFEVPQEIAQQALERWQAGLPLGDDDAKSEYMQAAQGAAVLGGVFGGVSGAVETGPPAMRARRNDKEQREEISKLEELADAKRNTAPVAPQPREEIDRPANEVLTNGAERDALEAPNLAPQTSDVEGPSVAGGDVAGRGDSITDVGGDVGPVGGDAPGSVEAVDGGGLGSSISPVEQVDEGTRASDDPVEAARKLVLETNNASLSYIQRELKLNYPSAVKIVKQLQQEGLVTEPDARGRRKVIAKETLTDLKGGLEEVTPAVTEEPEALEGAIPKHIQDKLDAARAAGKIKTPKSIGDLMPLSPGVARSAEPDIEPTNISEEDVTPEKPSDPIRYADDIDYDPPYKQAQAGDEKLRIKEDYSENPLVAKKEAKDELKRGDSVMRRIPKSATPEEAEELKVWGLKIKDAALAKLKELRDGLPVSETTKRLIEERGIEGAVEEISRKRASLYSGAQYYEKQGRPVPDGTAKQLAMFKRDLEVIQETRKPKKTIETLEDVQKEIARLRDKAFAEKAKTGEVSSETTTAREQMKARLAQMKAEQKSKLDMNSLESVRERVAQLESLVHSQKKSGGVKAETQAELDKMRARREELKAQEPNTRKGWPKGVKRPHRPRKDIEKTRFFDDLPSTPDWSTQELMKHVRDIELALSYVTRGWASAPNIFVVSEPKTNTTKLKVYERGRAQDARTELPAPVYERMKADGRLKAPALTTNDGTIYFIASNIPKGYSHVVKPIVFHEAFHSGIVSPEMAGKYQMEKDELMVRIYKDNAKYRGKADAWLKAHPEASFVEEGGQLVDSPQAKSITPIARAMDEVMAEEAQTAAFKRTPTWDLIKDFIRRWARKLFQKNMPFSDRDVEAVIRLAVASATSIKFNSSVDNKRILDKSSVSVESARYAPGDPKKKTVQNRVKRAQEKAAKLEDVISKSNPDETLDVAGELMKSMRGSTKSINRLKSVFGDTTIDRIRTILPVMTTDDITRWVGDRINNLKPINDAVTAMGAYRFNWRQDGAPLMEDWVSYYQKNRDGANELADTMHRATILQVDPGAHKDAATSVANDNTIKELKVKKAAAKNASAAGRVESDIKQREADIKLMYEFWDKLDQTAKDIFSRTRTYYKKQFAEYMSLLQKEVDDNADAATKEKLNKKIQDMFESAKEMEVYFPLRRYGKYWYQFGTGDSREFYMFDSAHQRNTAMRDRLELAKKGGETRTGEKMIEDGDLDLGSSSQQALNKEAGSNKMLSDMFKLIDGSTTLDKNALKEQVFTLYMNTLPNNSMRQNLRKRKTIAGFSRDALRNYVTSLNSASNQMAKLKYSSTIRNGVLSARDEIANNPDKEKLGAFVEEIEKRTELELMPDLPEEGEIDWNGLATMGNQAVFYYMLTSPKSAIVQMTQLHIVGLPVLSAKYGVGNTMKMAAKYGNPLFSLGIVKDGKMVPPSVSLSKAITEEKNKGKKADLAEGWEHANNLDKFMDTFVASTTERGKMSSATHASTGQTALRRTANFMSGAFHHLERVSREIMYMSAFELEYDAQIAAGKSRAEATEAAKQEGINQLEEALFNYSSYNKPRLAKNPLGKLGFQFMSYPIQMTSYLVRNFAALIKDLPPAEKKAAAIKLFGTIGMTGMYAGVVGLPGYALITGVADGMRALFGDPGDDDEDNPLTAHNTDIWFRQWFIPTYFGAGVVGRAVTYGPVSAFTGGDISGSTSLDGLWLRNDNPPDSYKDGFQQMLLGLTGPFGSMGSQISAGFDDFNNGDFDRGLEKLLPAFLRNFARTARYAGEGYVTKGNPGDTVKEAEWFTTGKLIGQSMGFAPMEIADIQQKTYALKREAETIVQKQAKLLDRLNRAMANDNEAEIDRVLEAIDKYNDRYAAVLPITADSMNSSIKNRLAVQAASIQGLRVNGKFRSAADELLGLSLEEE